MVLFIFLVLSKMLYKRSLWNVNINFVSNIICIIVNFVRRLLEVFVVEFYKVKKLKLIFLIIKYNDLYI